jgi:hypothetical protein
MTDFVTVALITAIPSLAIGLISGGIALWNNHRTNKNTNELQSMRGSIDRDLEQLRAKLSHGQNVSATQWSAEFAAYQLIWRSIVEVRPLADKLVNREGELHQIGLPKEYLDNEIRLKHRQDLTQQLMNAAQDLLSAIHDNAPFYPIQIRLAANEVHRAAIQLFKKNLSALTEAMNGNNIAQTREFYLEGVAILLQLMREADKVESLIRERLSAVQVINFTVI